MWRNTRRFFIGLLTLALLGCKNDSNSILVCVDDNLLEVLAYSFEKLESELEKKNIKITRVQNPSDVQLQLKIIETSSKEKNDGFVLKRTKDGLLLSSESNRGLLYGILDIEEQLRKGASWEALETKQIEAHYPFRAIKFNLPWFPYRGGENLSLHYDTCKDVKFWESFLDMMVENKFNVLSLWNLHPFMYMVQSEKFPQASPFTTEEMAEWKSFWKTIFSMAKARGIEPYIFNWNIFVSEEFSKAYNVAGYSKEGGYWGDGETNESIEAYTREMVTKTINEYEDIAGIGITLGERMGGMTSEMRKDWIDRTLIRGIKDADRKVKLFYRAPLSAGLTSHGTVSKATEVITREAIENIGMEDDVLLGFKFNWSHGHSSPKLSIVHGGILTDTYWNPKPKNYKGAYTLRNEDFFALRWAQPDFIRAYMEQNSQDHISGAIIGSETYIPAKDYITKEEYRSWDYAFEKQWLFYKTWGNLLYHQGTSDVYFNEALTEKYDIEEAPKLVDAWKMASQNANSFASFYRGEWDGTLYTEGMTREGGRFITVEKMITHPVLDSSYVNIADFVSGDFTKDKITPLQLADEMEQRSTAAEQIAMMVIESHPNNTLLEIETEDIIAWGHFGQYVADKIRGGVALQRYREEGNIDHKKEAIGHLENALLHWKDYVAEMEKYNVAVMPHQFDNEFSFRKHIEDAEMDITIARNSTP